MPDSPFGIGADSLNAVAFSPDGRFVATANYDSSSGSVLRFDKRTGALHAVPGSPFAAGFDSYDVAFSPNGKWLAWTNELAGSVAVSAVDPKTGSLTRVRGSPFKVGGNLTSVAFSPGSRSLAVPDGDSGVLVFAVNPVSGVLTPVPGSAFDTGGRAFWSAYSPSGRFLASSNFTSNTISVESVNRRSGVLRAAPGSPFESGPIPWQVAFSPDGALLAAANSDDTCDLNGGSDCNTVGVFAVNPETGALEEVPGSPFATGQMPLSVAFSPNELLAVAASSGVSLFLASTHAARVSSPLRAIGSHCRISPRNPTVSSPSGSRCRAQAL